MNRKEIFFQRLRDEMKKRRVSEARLGERIGISRGSVYQWMHRDTYPCVEDLLSICAEFSVTPDYLLGYTLRGFPDKYYHDALNAINEGRKDWTDKEKFRLIVAILDAENVEKQKS